MIPRRMQSCRYIVLAMLMAFTGCSPETEAPPSVILVVIDTLRRDHLSLHGYAKKTTPGLEGLAREASVFERCLATSSWTKPSTVSLLTGLYPPSHGIHRLLRAPQQYVFLAERLRENGYATAAFSGNPHVSPTFGMSQGFDHFAHQNSNERVQDYPDAVEILDDARGWLETSPQEPFFLYLHLMNVHGPYRAPPEYRARFLEEPHTEFTFRNETWIEIVRRGRLEERAKVTDAHLNDLRARYDGAIAYTDEVLMSFLEELRSSGVLDRSLLVVTSDHGEELFEHGGFGHRRTLYGELLEVPLLIRDPDGRGSGRRIEQPVSLVDVPATILDRLGLLEAGPDGGFGDGRSLVPLLSDAVEAPTPRLLLAQLDEKSAGSALLIQKWPYRLLQIENDYRGNDDAVELYDVENDPREQTDLAPRSQRRVSRLTALAREFRAALENSRFEGDKVQLDEDMRRRLEALGYVQ